MAAQKVADFFAQLQIIVNAQALMKFSSCNYDSVK